MERTFSDRVTLYVEEPLQADTVLAALGDWPIGMAERLELVIGSSSPVTARFTHPCGDVFVFPVEAIRPRSAIPYIAPPDRGPDPDPSTAPEAWKAWIAAHNRAV